NFWHSVHHLIFSPDYLPFKQFNKRISGLRVREKHLPIAERTTQVLRYLVAVEQQHLIIIHQFWHECIDDLVFRPLLLHIIQWTHEVNPDREHATTCFDGAIILSITRL